ncbi:MAG: DnaA/Hda family protein [Nanoarchaeota archaeon]|nr:DnaA/Hda family protein [Nanoarchaeota archaeon]
MTLISTSTTDKIYEAIKFPQKELHLPSSRFLKLNNGELEITVSNRFDGEYLKNTYLPEIQGVANKYIGVNGSDVPIVFVASESKYNNLLGLPEKERENESQVQPQVQTPLSSNLPSAKYVSCPKTPYSHDFEYLIEHEGNRDALSVAKNITSNFKQGAGHPILLIGPGGCGKTEIMSATMNEFTKKEKGMSGYLNARSLFYTVTRNHSNISEVMQEFFGYFKDVGMIGIDDIGELFPNTRERMQQETVNILRNTSTNGGQIIYAYQGESPSELFENLKGAKAGLEEMVSESEIIYMANPSIEERPRVISKILSRFNVEKAAAREIGEYISKNLSPGSSLRQIYGQVRTITGYASRNKKQITPELAQGMLNYSPQRTLFDIVNPLHAISALSEEIVGYPAADMVNRRRINAEISKKRDYMIWLTHKLTNTKLGKLGKCFGGRSHSTISLAIKRAEEGLTELEKEDLLSRASSLLNLPQ